VLHVCVHVLDVRVRVQHIRRTYLDISKLFNNTTRVIRKHVTFKYKHLYVNEHLFIFIFTYMYNIYIFDTFIVTQNVLDTLTGSICIEECKVLQADRFQYKQCSNGLDAFDPDR
jgi:hypothetical protein